MDAALAQKQIRGISKAGETLRGDPFTGFNERCSKFNAFSSL
jgi:hypothetical protein